MLSQRQAIPSFTLARLGKYLAVLSCGEAILSWPFMHFGKYRAILSQRKAVPSFTLARLGKYQVSLSLNLVRLGKYPIRLGKYPVDRPCIRATP